jgi:hypothetical protein
MLYYKTIDTKTLELLKKLQKISIFKNLRLVGGTALALQIGHRKSVDIDLFGVLEADIYELSEAISQFGQVTLLNRTKNINIYLIDGVKVDIVNYHYPWIENPQIFDDILMAHPKDIIAMKLAAITGRGSKKDFIDLYFLLQSFLLTEMLNLYEKKYADGSVFLVLKSLSYFDDADKQELPSMLKHIRWDEVKTFINNQLDIYHKNN